MSDMTCVIQHILQLPCEPVDNIRLILGAIKQVKKIDTSPIVKGSSLCKKLWHSVTFI